MKTIWERWEINYFSTLYEKLLNRTDVFGNRNYTPKGAFDFLNFKYKRVFGKQRYKNLESFKQCRNRQLRK